MDIFRLMQMNPWDVPAGTSEKALEAILDRDLPDEKRIQVILFSAEITVMDDAIAKVLMDIAESDDEPEELRGSALTSLGTMLAEAELNADDGLGDDDEIPVATVEAIRQRMHALHDNATVPKLVRRRALEGSSRYCQDWHRDAIRAAYENGDAEWRLTAVFCMIFVRGFEEEIRESLESDDEMVFYHAIEAAGNFGIKEAWPYVKSILEDDKVKEGLLYAAVAAAPLVNRVEGGEILRELVLNNDEDLADAAEDALIMAGIGSPLNDFNDSF